MAIGRTIILAGAVAVAMSAGLTVRNVLATNMRWVQESAERTTNIGAPELFQTLFDPKQPVAKLDLASMRISLPPPDCEDRLRVDANDPACQGPKDEIIALVRRLYGTSAGQEVIGEVEAWNTAFNIVAVRDDNRKGERCEKELEAEETNQVDYAIPRGCHPTQWQARLSGAGAASFDISHRTAADPSVQLFGFLAAQRLTGFGDWLSLDLAGLPARRVILFSDAIELKPNKLVRIDLIGDLEAITLGDGQRVELPDVSRGGDSQIRLPTGGTLRVSRELFCLDAGKLDVPRCSADLLADGSPYGTRISVALQGGKATFKGRLALEVTPVRSLGARLRAVKEGQFCGISEIGKKLERARIRCDLDAAPKRVVIQQRVTDSILFWCQGPAEKRLEQVGAAAQCFLSWADVERRARLGQPSFQVRMNDGTVLAESGEHKVRLDPKVAELGLLPVVGIGKSDFLSLTGQLATRSGNEERIDIELTIDPVMQDIVDNTLTRVMTRSKDTSVIWSRMPKGADARRRAAVVLIDAGDAAGEVLAVSTWPKLTPKNPLGEWDLRALDVWNPSGSPLATLGWSQNDFLTVPGSTFKSLTSLAAMQRLAEGDDKLAKVVFGMKNEGELRSVMAINFGDTGYQADPRNRGTFIGNAGGERVGDAFLAASQTGCPPVSGGRGQIGICEATIKSINSFFARLAVMLDEQSLKAVPRGKRADEIAMTRMVSRLWPGGGLSLAEGSPARLSRGSRMFATPISIDARVAPVLDLNRLHVLALNGMGQAVQATPTAMASIYASIATGRIVTPRLIKRAPPAEGAPAPEPAPFVIDGVGSEAELDKLLLPLRRGLKAVVSFAGGTADNAFRPFGDMHQYVWGKTGTATVTDGDDRRAGSARTGHTVWFAGWIDPAGDSFWLKGKAAKSPVKRRIAFACMVTHSDGFGGTVCAPLIAKILDQIGRAGAK